MLKHNFVPGMRLSAKALNEIETQIETNTDNIATLNEDAQSESERIAQAIQSLSLSTDGQYLYIKSNNVQISAVKIADMIINSADIIQCTNLDILSALSLDLEVGDTSLITYSISPNDCNQTVQFSSSPSGIITVNSNGQITVLKIGICDITVKCGNQQKTIKVYASGEIIPHFGVANWINTSTNYIAFSQSGADGSLGIGVSDSTLIKVPAGFNINISCLGTASQYGHNDCYFNQIIKFNPTETTSFGTVNGVLRLQNIENVETVDPIANTNKKVFSIDCLNETWIAGVFRGDSGFVCPDNADTLMTDYPNLIKITLTPIKD